jgi:GNAT superfamily N-acetyltransferase
MIKLEPLSWSSLEEAGRKADALFPNDPELPSFWFRESLVEEKDRAHEYWLKYKENTVRYWVALDDENGEIVGGTGLYDLTDEKDICWLGWYWVIPSQRGKGIGKELLRFSIETARAEGKKYLRLYTTEEPETQLANAQYDRLGFREFGREYIPEHKQTIIYKGLKLS